MDVKSVSYVGKRSGYQIVVLFKRIMNTRRIYFECSLYLQLMS